MTHPIKFTILPQSFVYLKEIAYLQEALGQVTSLKIFFVSVHLAIETHTIFRFSANFNMRKCARTY